MERYEMFRTQDQQAASIGEKEQNKGKKLRQPQISVMVIEPVITQEVMRIERI